MMTFNEQDATSAAEKAGIDISKYDMTQILDGMVIEQEHAGKTGESTDLTIGMGDEEKNEVVLKVAIAHLMEIPDYYTRLKTMEDDAKKEANDNGQKEIQESLDKILELINNKTITLKDMNIFFEALAKSAKERVDRQTRPEVGPEIKDVDKKVKSKVQRKGNTDPTQTLRGKQAVKKQGEKNKKNADKFKKFNESFEFVGSFNGKPIHESLAGVAKVKDSSTLVEFLEMVCARKDVESVNIKWANALLKKMK